MVKDYILKEFDSGHYPIGEKHVRFICLGLVNINKKTSYINIYQRHIDNDEGFVFKVDGPFHRDSVHEIVDTV